MSRPPGVKNGEGLDQRIIDFFEANPGEWLTYKDIMIKFGCTRRRFFEAMKGLRQQGVIEVAVIARRVEVKASHE